MKEFIFDQFRLICSDPVYGKDYLPFSEEKAGNTLRFHRSIQEYHKTPLVSLRCAAKKYGVSVMKEL